MLLFKFRRHLCKGSISFMLINQFYQSCETHRCSWWAGRDVHFRSLQSISLADYHDTYSHLKGKIHLKLSERVLESEGEWAIPFDFRLALLPRQKTSLCELASCCDSSCCWISSSYNIFTRRVFFTVIFS